MAQLQSNGRRGAPLLLNAYSAARSQAAKPNAATLSKRAAEARKAQMSASLALIDKVLRGYGVGPGTIQKAKGTKQSAPLGLGELLQARLLRNRLVGEGKL